MVRLVIDNQDVVLPEDARLELWRENPLFEHKGNYTYDFDIDLRIAQNRKIYGHIDRVNVDARHTQRAARIEIDGRCVCNGTEILLEKNEDRIKIQVVSGLSEVNYLIGNETRIRSLDFGQVSVESPAAAKTQGLATADLFYPAVNHVWPPVLKNYVSHIEFQKSNWLDLPRGTYEMHYADDTEMWPQPFLLYYVERLVALLGYTLTHNALRDISKWCRLLVTHNYRTYDYAKMLPDWTTQEFIENIEKFFNCVFVIDDIHKTCQIISGNTFYTSARTFHLGDVTDAFDADFDTDENEMYISYGSVAYQAPSNKYRKYASIDKDVLDLCEIVEADYRDCRANCASISQNEWKVFYDPNRQLYFVRDTSIDGGFREVQQCAPAGDSDDGTSVSIGIIPCEIHSILYNWEALDGWIYGYRAYPCPSVVASEDVTKSFHESIQNGISDNALSYMEVAFYAGVYGLFWPSTNDDFTLEQAFPQCFCNHYMLEDGEYCLKFKESNLPGADSMNLRLWGQNGRVRLDFDNNYVVDTTRVYTFRFITRQMLDPAMKFIIRNRAFCCRKLKYTIKNGHLSDQVEGEFYPFK